MKHLDLFSGIGGFSYAADQVWDDVEHIFCEIDPFCQQVLKKHWPDSLTYDNIKELIWLLQTQKTNNYGENATPKKSESIGENTIGGTEKTYLKVADKELKPNEQHRKQLSSTIMEQSVLVAEKPPKPFSHLTTSTEMEQKKENSMELQELMAELSKRAFRKPIKYSATTATKRKVETANALTGTVDLLTAGFPCQPFSAAGKRKGWEDDRYLWPELYAVIKYVKPTWVIVENVRGLINLADGVVFQQVCTDLEAEGYEVQPFIIPAVAVNAPHRRDRIWWVARNPKYTRQHGAKDGESTAQRSHNNQARQNQSKQSKGPDSSRQATAHAPSQRLRRHSAREKLQPKTPGTQLRMGKENWDTDWLEVATRLCGVFNGVSAGLDRSVNDGIYSRYAKTLSEITRQDLPCLWQGFQSQAFQWSIGRFNTLQNKDYLFTVLWQYSFQPNRPNHLPFESKEVQEAYLRNVWHEKQSGCPPQGWRYNEQYAQKHKDTLSQMSFGVAQVAAEIWEKYNANRVHRLKALGNAIVPQVAKEIMEGIKCS